MMKEATGKLVQDVDLAWDEEVRKDLLVFFEGIITPLPAGRPTLSFFGRQTPQGESKRSKKAKGKSKKRMVE